LTGETAGGETYMEGTELRPAPADGNCPNCRANEWQFVEQVQQWHHGRFVPGEGFVFEGNHEWDQVSDEGDPLFLECRSCLASFELPALTWGVVNE
jgi:hypothetical protein